MGIENREQRGIAWSNAVSLPLMGIENENHVVRVNGIKLHSLPLMGIENLMALNYDSSDPTHSLPLMGIENPPAPCR